MAVVMLEREKKHAMSIGHLMRTQLNNTGRFVITLLGTSAVAADKMKNETRSAETIESPIVSCICKVLFFTHSKQRLW
jgi:hypothetical protein